jgi:hypothetical protein
MFSIRIRKDLEVVVTNYSSYHPRNYLKGLRKITKMLVIATWVLAEIQTGKVLNSNIQLYP